MGGTPSPSRSLDGLHGKSQSKMDENWGYPNLGMDDEQGSPYDLGNVHMLTSYRRYVPSTELRLPVSAYQCDTVSIVGSINCWLVVWNICFLHIWEE